MTNGYLVEAPQGNVLIDAPEGVADWLQEEDKKVHTLLLTHSHFDHVMDVAAVVKAQDGACPVVAFAHPSPELDLSALFNELAGGGIEIAPYSVDLIVEGQNSAAVGGLEWELLHVPGHSPDSVCFFSREHAQVFAGDTLFQDGVGRTDLPGGSQTQLFQGIRDKLYTLGNDVHVYPGHGDVTTIGREKEHGVIQMGFPD